MIPKLSQILKAKTTGDKKKEILSGLRYFFLHSMGHFDSTNAIFNLFSFQAWLPILSLKKTHETVNHMKESNADKAQSQQ